MSRTKTKAIENSKRQMDFTDFIQGNNLLYFFHCYLAIVSLTSQFLSLFYNHFTTALLPLCYLFISTSLPFHQHFSTSLLLLHYHFVTASIRLLPLHYHITIAFCTLLLLYYLQYCKIPIISLLFFLLFRLGNVAIISRCFQKFFSWIEVGIHRYIFYSI